MKKLVNVVRINISNGVIPEVMYSAVEVAKCGGPEVLKIVQKTLPTTLERTQILVKVMAAGINPVDTYVRTGAQGYNPSLPYVPGNDLAGEVQSIGEDVKRFKKGSRIYSVKAPFSSGVHTGAYAQYCVMDEIMAHPLPNNTTYPQGASLGTPYYTAYRALCLRGNAKPGESLLVHGASGGVGLAACQLAKSMGLRVFGTASTSEGVDLVKKCGAEQVFNHKEDGYTEKIMEACTGGMNNIVEMLANVNLQKDLDMIAPRGRILIVGSRGNIEITPRSTMTRECNVMGVKYGGTTAAELNETECALHVGMEQGWISPVIDKEYPLERAAQAHEDIIQSTGAKGNLVFVPKH